jgi:hypothetical protein
MKFGTVASACGAIVTLPGLPTEERGAVASSQPMIELHLDAPTGPCVGKLTPSKTSCAIQGASGIHNLFLVFTGNAVSSVDWLRFELGESAQNSSAKQQQVRRVSADRDENQRK